MYNESKVINPAAMVEDLFYKAVDGEQDLELLETGPGKHTLSYWDRKNQYERIYWFEDTARTLADRIVMDEQVSQLIRKDDLAAFLVQKMDPACIMVMNRFALIWDNEEGKSPVRDNLEKEYNDEYGQFIAQWPILGQLWADRQIPVVNVSAVMDSCLEIYEREDGPFETFFIEALLQTIYHEFRHLFYECNEIIEIGDGTEYPIDEGMEENVEEYANAKAAADLTVFSSLIFYFKILKLRKEREKE